MERRRFLSLLGLGAAGFALDSERLLWVPGQKRIFDFGGIEEYSGNTLITAEWVTKEVAKYWRDSIKAVGQFDRRWDDAFRMKEFA